jgi:hypothetical protein
MKPVRLALLALVVLAGGAGCSLPGQSASADRTDAPDVPQAPAAPTSTTTAPAARPASRPASTTPTTWPVAAPSSYPRVNGFQTPSGNIACIVNNDAGDVRCDIEHVNFAVPPEPASCELDWGQTFIIDAEDVSADFACVGDTLLGPDQPKVPAGTSVVIGRSICEVDTRSIACTVSETDGGLFLSEDRYYTSFEEG